MKLDYDNTRYFCLNLESIIEYENLDVKSLLNKNESKKSSEVKSKKGIELENPFTSIESKKGSKLESEKSNYRESEKNPDMFEKILPGRKSKEV